MERMFPVKEEYSGWSSAPAVVEYGPPRPVEGLHEMGPPPFLMKTFDMVDDFSIDHIVSWSRGGKSFVVWDPNAFSTSVLPKYFKHNNFSSFVRQLNTYGFRKIDPDKWEFANEAFLRGQKHLLRNILRRKTTTTATSQRAIGLEAEIYSLRRDKEALFREIVKLRQQQVNTRACLQQMEMRLQGTERKQQQMMSFLARAMQNPKFINQLLQLKEQRKEVKRMRPIKTGESSRDENRIKIEPIEFEQVSELEALAWEMQGIGRVKRDGEYDMELDDGFWEELLNEGFDEVGEEDVNVLACNLGFMGK